MYPFIYKLFAAVLTSVAILALLLICTDTDIGKKYYIGGQYIGWTDYWYTSN